jgi:hypothetical protein
MKIKKIVTEANEKNKDDSFYAKMRDASNALDNDPMFLIKIEKQTR